MGTYSLVVDGPMITLCPTLTLAGCDRPGIATGTLSGARSSLLPAGCGTPLIHTVRSPPCFCTMPLTVNERALPGEGSFFCWLYSSCARCLAVKNNRPSSLALDEVVMASRPTAMQSFVIPA